MYSRDWSILAAPMHSAHADIMQSGIDCHLKRCSINVSVRSRVSVAYASRFIDQRRCAHVGSLQLVTW
jgi:hypothetical protein